MKKLSLSFLMAALLLGVAPLDAAVSKARAIKCAIPRLHRRFKCNAEERAAGKKWLIGASIATVIVALGALGIAAARARKEKNKASSLGDVSSAPTVDPLFFSTSKRYDREYGSNWRAPLKRFILDENPHQPDKKEAIEIVWALEEALGVQRIKYTELCHPDGSFLTDDEIKKIKAETGHSDKLRIANSNAEVLFREGDLWRYVHCYFRNDKEYMDWAQTDHRGR